MATVRAIFTGGSHGGPPTDIEALPDGSPPPLVRFEETAPIMAARPSGFWQLATVGEVYVLAPHQHASTQGRAPWRYACVGDRPRPGLPAEGST